MALLSLGVLGLCQMLSASGQLVGSPALCAGAGKDRRGPAVGVEPLQQCSRLLRLLGAPPLVQVLRKQRNSVLFQNVRNT